MKTITAYFEQTRPEAPRLAFQRLGARLFLLLTLATSPAVGLGQEDPRSVVGEWSEPIAMENVPIHVNLLHTGKVLYWGRREWNANIPEPDLDPHDCTPRLWDPQTGIITKTEQPKLQDGTTVNLFCAGHAFLPDGRLLVAGGHLHDSAGVNQVIIFDPDSNAWTPMTQKMNAGRWYPTVVVLSDGNVLVAGGTDENEQPNKRLQVFEENEWKDLVGFDGLPLYPRMHVVPDGRVFMSGALNLTQFLNTGDQGNRWTPLAPEGRRNPEQGFNILQEYGCSVLYVTKNNEIGIMYVGGGIPPTNSAKTLVLNKPGEVWKPTDSMDFKRRQHNATLLADGTILVTGGTQGDGGPVGETEKGFNDLAIGQPLRSAELWDPDTGQWSRLAKASFDRCYHSTAILLPDATVLSAGGGEYRPVPNTENARKDSHLNAQVFSPPYLFKGPRPVISSAPKSIRYGDPAFQVATPSPGDVARISLIAPGSVTHSFDFGQRICFLEFSVEADHLSVKTPTQRNECPPGYYLMFLLSKQGVPSTAAFIKLEVNPATPN